MTASSSSSPLSLESGATTSGLRLFLRAGAELVAALEACSRRAARDDDRSARPSPSGLADASPALRVRPPLLLFRSLERVDLMTPRPSPLFPRLPSRQLPAASPTSNHVSRPRSILPRPRNAPPAQTQAPPTQAHLRLSAKACAARSRAHSRAPRPRPTARPPCVSRVASRPPAPTFDWARTKFILRSRSP